MFFNAPRILGLLLTTLLSIQFASGATYQNPLKSPNGSDPFMVYNNGFYYLLTTTWTNIQITRSTTLGGLKTATPKVVWTDSTPSRSGNFWAPEVHFLSGCWYLYYSAGTQQCCDNQRSHVLQGGTDLWNDPFTYAAQMSNEWGIDSTVLTLPQGNYYVWSRFSNRSLQSIFIAKMNSPTSIGLPHLLSEPTNAWETVGGAVNEGPAALQHGGKTWLTFSASYCWTASYQLGLLTYNGGDPLQQSSWTKSGPVFSSANGNLGTGHNGFFTSPDGTELWNVYHATKTPGGACDGSRYTMAQKMNWNTDGSPNFGRAPNLMTILQGPSGE
ncbi:glycoside hydrolase [Wilcoxina mikolae CBS 423.85]|nr:glycoside hydrolase [Wilcoxina mikolae CBS 423.85]